MASDPTEAGIKGGVRGFGRGEHSRYVVARGQMNNKEKRENRKDD